MLIQTRHDSRGCCRYLFEDSVPRHPNLGGVRAQGPGGAAAAPHLPPPVCRWPPPWQRPLLRPTPRPAWGKERQGARREARARAKSVAAPIARERYGAWHGQVRRVTDAKQGP